MPTADLNLFNGIYSKLDYLGTRQRTIATNIAHADTPGYQAQDVPEPDFRRILGETTSRSALSGSTGGSASVSRPGVATTNPAHFDINGSTGTDSRPRERDAETSETAPSGNNVVIEDQLFLANQVVADHGIASNIHERYVNMLRSATGRNR